MSEPNAQTKKRQMMLIGGAVTGILGLAGAGMFLFDSGPAQHREKPKP
jgi:conjugal transfer pilus assembly protein TraB